MRLRIDGSDCEPLFGFNSKQWWVYNKKYDVVIDPPTEVLEELERWNFNEQEDKLAEILKENPDWLNDTDYIYKDVEI